MITPQQIYETNKTKYDALIKYFQQENEKINLSSFNDTENILNKHILDSLEIFGFEYWESLLNDDSQELTVADIGSGSGFPGLALAVALPNVNFILIDSIGKKCRAIQTMSAKLALKNVKVINDRAENLKEKYDIVISRGVAAFPIIIDWSRKLVQDEGKIFLYKSNKEKITEDDDKIKYRVGDDTRVIYEF